MSGGRSSSGASCSGFVGRVEERVRRETAFGRELDRARHREVRGVDGHLEARAEHLVVPTRDVEQRRAVIGIVAEPATKTAVEPSATRYGRAPPRVVRQVERLERARLRVEDAERRASVAARTRRRRIRRPEERVRAAAEDPRRIPELGLGRMQHGALAVLDALEVPPAAAVAREHEVAGRAPLGLPDRLLAVAAGDERRRRRACRPRRARRRRARSRPTASTGRSQARKAMRCAVGRDARARVEVASLGDDPRLAPSRRSGARRARSRPRPDARSPNDARARRSTVSAVGSDAAVGVAVRRPSTAGRDRDAAPSRIDAVEALVVEAGAEDDPVVDAVRAAAVLVDHRADVECGRRQRRPAAPRPVPRARARRGRPRPVALRATTRCRSRATAS